MDTLTDLTYTGAVDLLTDLYNNAPDDYKTMLDELGNYSFPARENHAL